jgi:hypothetical protein
MGGGGDGQHLCMRSGVLKRFGKVVRPCNDSVPANNNGANRYLPFHCRRMGFFERFCHKRRVGIGWNVATMCHGDAKITINRLGKMTEKKRADCNNGSRLFVALLLF